MQRPLWHFAIGFVAAMLAVRPADACSLRFPDPFELQPVAGDTTPPAAPIVTAIDAPPARELGPGGCDRDACSGTTSGSINLEITLGDDTTPPNEIGCFVSIVAGEPPEGFFDGEGFDDGVAQCAQLFLPHADTGPFAFDLSIQAVDKSGNLGPATIVRIENLEGGGGCNTGRRTHPAAMFGLALLTFALVIRRRR